MTHDERATNLLHFINAYADFSEKCAEYQRQALLKHEATLYDVSMEVVEFHKKKSKVEETVGRSGINYEALHTGWSSDEKEGNKEHMYTEGDPGRESCTSPYEFQKEEG